MDFEASTIRNEDSHAEFLKVYFSFAYYLGFIPYKFVLGQKDGKNYHRTHGYFINKVISAIIHILLLIDITGSFKNDIHPIPEPGAPETLTYYFKLAFRLCSILYYVSYFTLFWRKSDAIAQLLDDLNSPPSHLEIKSVISTFGQIKARATVICSLFTFLAILSLIMKFREIVPSMDMQKILGAYAGFAKFTFFGASTNRPIPAEEMNLGMTIFAVFYVCVRYFSFIKGFFSDLMILMFVLSFRSITFKFFEYIDTNNRVGYQFVIQKYKFMKRTLEKINHIVGLTYSLGLLMTYPVNIIYFGNLSDTTDDWFVILSNFFFAFNFVAVMITAARAVENVGRLTNYLKVEENRKNMSEIDLIVIQEELKNSPFGIQGKGLAVVTYRYIRRILSKFLSYTLLLILFQFTRKSSAEYTCCP